MNVSVLSQVNFLSPGAPLWVLLGYQENHLALKIDWYLNFQIERSLKRSKVQLSNEILDFVNRCELDLPSIEADERALLLPASHALPSSWVVCIESAKSEETAEKIYSIWKNLGKPTVRIFTPASENRLEAQLKKHDFLGEVQIMMDGPGAV